MNTPHLRYKDQTRRERTWTIHFISLEKTVKGIVLVVVGFRLLTLFNRDVHAWAEDFVTRHGIDIANRYVQSGLERLSGVGNRQLVMFSVGAFIYAALLFTEGIGLWLQKRWAEYLTACATALFIPVELYELYQRFTWVRISILILNVFVVWYLATRLKDEKQEGSATEFTKNTDTGPIRVKICGITNLEDAMFVIESGADELGFNFYSESSRYVEPPIALEIIKKLPHEIIKIGVFVNEEPYTIGECVDMLNLDAVQLHGDEDAGFIDKLRKETDAMIVKALTVTRGIVAKDVLKYGADAILLDGYSPKGRGGTGETFDWSFAVAVKESFPTIYLAGGLNPENVAQAVRIVRPYAVDVASGVESSPGKKDRKKVAAFIKAAKEAL